MWDGTICRQVINLFAVPAGTMKGVATLDLRRIPGLTRLLMTSDGRRHLLCKLNGQSWQICLSGAPLGRSVHVLADTVLAPGRLHAGLRAIEAFNLLLDERAGRTSAGSEPRNHRLRQVLAALDGRRAGASYRDIAILLYGASRVKLDWGDGGDHMKSHVRRLVKRGEALVDGGYMRLLQQGL